MHHPRHINPDHYLNLEQALEVSREEVLAAWELAYAKLSAQLQELGSGATLYLVCGLQGAGKTHWVLQQLDKTGPDALFLDGALPSRRHRQRALALTKAAGCRAIAVWINTPLEQALAQNALRQGLARIREETILHVLEQFEIPDTEEGFASILEVRGGQTLQVAGAAVAVGAVGVIS